jgi:hypothetical protein
MWDAIATLLKLDPEMESKLVGVEGVMGIWSM